MTLWTASASRFRLSAAMAVFCVVSILCSAAYAELSPPTSVEKTIAQAVAVLLPNDHLSKRPLDNEISQRCLKTFLKDLDPWKIYFYQKDVDEFIRHQDELDDLAKRRNTEKFLDFAHNIFRVLLERVDERAKLVEELLAMEHDFTADEEIVRDPDLARYARNQAEAREKWRKLVKLDLLSLKADGTEGEEALKKLQKRYRSRFLRMHQIDNQELLEMYLTALTSAYDPHSSYMSPKTVENFEILMKLKLEGIGAALQSVDGRRSSRGSSPAEQRTRTGG